MTPGLQRVAAYTGLSVDALHHVAECVVCAPGAPCDANPDLISAAVAAYRSGGALPRRREVEDVDPDVDQDVLAQIRAARSRQTVPSDPRKADPFGRE